MRVFLGGVGLVMPAAENWQRAKEVFGNADEYDISTSLAPMAKKLLPANERRRTTRLIQMALHAGQDAVQDSKGDLATVFASSCGDLEIMDKIMQALTQPSRPVSPTQFHNSVHNAPAGYWSILAGCNAPSTSISAWDESFSAGLVEAATQVLTEHQQVLLVAYDSPAPDRLVAKRKITAPFAVGLLLTAQDIGPSLTIELIQAGRESGMKNASLESLRLANPAARSLPLLQLLAAEGNGKVKLPYMNGQQVRVQVSE